MDQAWTKQGKRLAVTRCQVEPNLVVAQHAPARKPSLTLRSFHSAQTDPILEIGYGRKKLKSMSKPLRAKLQQSGFSQGVRRLYGMVAPTDSQLKPGDQLKLEQVLSVGDVVNVQGVSKGRGFSGAVKRHGFHGGPATHGQSDRERSVGSIGAGSTPGKVWKGKKMPGRYGGVKKTVTGLVVVYVDPASQQLWLSGPVPGHRHAALHITKTGQTKQLELVDAPSPQPDQPSEAAHPEPTDQPAKPGQSGNPDQPAQSIPQQST